MVLQGSPKIWDLATGVYRPMIFCNNGSFSDKTFIFFAAMPVHLIYIKNVNTATLTIAIFKVIIMFAL